MKWLFFIVYKISDSMNTGIMLKYTYDENLGVCKWERDMDNSPCYFRKMRTKIEKKSHGLDMKNPVSEGIIKNTIEDQY